MNYWGDKKVLVTGASGLIGSHIIEELVRQNADATGIKYKKEMSILGAKYGQGDLTDFQICKDFCEGQEAVFHCAAVSEGAKTMSENMLKLVRDNVIMNVNMLEAAYRAGVKLFVFISSTTVNHLKEYRGVADVKDFTEKLCELYSQKGMQCVIIRPTNVYGPRDKFDDRAHTIPMFIKRAINKENPFTVWGDGQQKRDFIYVKDLVKAILNISIIKDIKKDTTPVTIGSGITLTVEFVAWNIYKSINGEYPTLNFDKSKPTMLQDNLPVLDYKTHTTDFTDGIFETVKWYKENKDGQY